MASFFTDMTFLADGSFSESLQTVWHFFSKGGWFMLPIGICSLAAITLVLFKFLDLKRETILPSWLAAQMESIDSLAKNGRLAEFEQPLRADDSVLARICRAALSSRNATRDDAARNAESVAREEVARLERGIPVLEVIFTVAPLLGLIGTVSGLVTIFGNFGSKIRTAEQSSMIATGISEALNCTIFGLAVAVPTYFFQSFFARKVEALALRMGTLVSGLISVYYRDPSATDEPAASFADAVPRGR